MATNSIAGESVDQSWLSTIVDERRWRKYHDNSGARREFDATELEAARHFAPYFHSGLRLKVRRTYEGGEEHVRTGTVGITTGWRPAFLLMHRSNAHGSWDVLGPEDEIIATWDGRRYEPVKKARET